MDEQNKLTCQIDIRKNENLFNNRQKYVVCTKIFLLFSLL